MLQIFSNDLYDNNTGRWLSEDPMGFGAGDSNLYRYVSNEPLSRLDPSGFDFIAVGGRTIVFPPPVGQFGHLSLEVAQPLGAKASSAERMIGYSKTIYVFVLPDVCGGAWSMATTKCRFR